MSAAPHGWPTPGPIEGVTSVGVGFDVLSDGEKQGLQEKLGRPGGLRLAHRIARWIHGSSSPAYTPP